jgi:putative ABC transport system permease protein
LIRHLSRLLWHRRRQNALVALEILVAFLVLFAVVTLGTQAVSASRLPLGFEWRDRWDVSLEGPREVAAGAETTALMQQVVLAMREFPEVQGVAGVHPAPYTDSNRFSAYTRDGRHVAFREALATDDYAEVAKLSIVQGRWFSKEDDGVAHVPVVISESFAAELFPGQDPLGRNVAGDPEPGGEPEPERRVVGVMKDYRQDGEYMWPQHYVFVRSRLDDPREVPPDHFMVQVGPGASADLEERMTRRLEQVAREWSVRVRPVAQLREQKNRFAVAPLAALGIVAVFLMLMVFLGLSGVLWQAVTQRTREIGLRRAKGATAGDVHRQVLLEIGILTTLAVGVGAALVVQLPLLDLVGGVQGSVYAASLALTVAAIYVLTLACGLYPGRLATRLSPAEALHYE